MNINENTFYVDPGYTPDNPEARQVYSVGGYSYTFEDLEHFADTCRIEWTDRRTLLGLFKRHIRQHDLVTLYEDSRAKTTLCFVIGYQCGYCTLGHRFKPDAIDEKIRRICVKFGFPENPPFRTVKDPTGIAYPSLSQELRQLPEWYNEAGSESESGNGSDHK
ncbi:hypothetical protein BDN70DRAFT_930590 [Pholiota conissans]|uniref:Uncharacterized protein n=1 Tax=Pholiota conissans TaxID=109636 RepID=A0A9P5Z680_9AGAR|nr:hypothetical protein BDN70DRAFT_930590 [Pholiota conissans]